MPGPGIAGRRVRVVEGHLVVERRPDAALAVDAVAGGAVRLEERVATRDVGDVLLLADLLQSPEMPRAGTPMA